MGSQIDYDLVILGGGAAAFAAITEAHARGVTTAMVNVGLPLGGTCVNVGCVPSKHLIEVGKTAFEPSRNPFDAIQYDGEPTTDWPAALDEKDGLVGQLRRENYVDVADHFETDVYEGCGRFVENTTIEVLSGEDEGARITGEKALIATGSSPWPAPIDGLDEIDYETSESILERRDLSESMIMIGGGYIALEWGQILHHVGVDVTILQRSGHVLSGMEGQLGRELQRCFHKDGIEVVTGVDIQRVSGTDDVATDGGLTTTEDSISVEASVDGAKRAFDAAAVFVATGVRPNTDGTGLDDIGVETDSSGAVIVNEHFQTANHDVYAAGDVIGDLELETVAAKEGNHAVKNAFGNERQTIDYETAPKVVFTSPEVATVLRLVTLLSIR
jgi:mercuric reductase